MIGNHNSLLKLVIITKTIFFFVSYIKQIAKKKCTLSLEKCAPPFLFSKSQICRLLFFPLHPNRPSSRCSHRSWWYDQAWWFAYHHSVRQHFSSAVDCFSAQLFISVPFAGGLCRPLLFWCLVWWIVGFVSHLSLGSRFLCMFGSTQFSFH
jgi:hypothetical protein